MVKKLRSLHMVTLYNTYTRYTHAHYQEFIVVKFLQGLVVIAISQLLDLRKNLRNVEITIFFYSYVFTAQTTGLWKTACDSLAQTRERHRYTEHEY